MHLKFRLQNGCNFVSEKLPPTIDSKYMLPVQALNDKTVWD